MTLSRGGIAAAIIGLLTVLVTIAPRPVALRTMLAPAVGSGVLVAAMLDTPEVRDAVGGSAQSSAGADLIPLAVLVVVGVTLVQAGWHFADRAHWTRRVPRTGRRTALIAGITAVAFAVVVALAVGAPGRVSRAWTDFKDPDTSALKASEGSVDRLSAVNGAGRYEEWSGAIRAFRENPVGGIGLGGWDSWWSPRRITSPPVRNAHSEPLEIAAELGVIGIALLAVLVLSPLGAALRQAGRRRPTRPAATVVAPALVAFVVSICVDWSWQLSAIPVAVALLAAVAVGRERVEAGGPGVPAAASTRGAGSRRTFASLAGVAVLAVASIGTLAVAMIAPQGVERSSAAESSGALGRAADEARKTTNAAPFALSPVLQQALVLERSGDLPGAAAAAREATRVEPRNWRPWLVLARIEATRDRPKAAVEAYRRAKALNPRSRLVTP
jgi:hypothetical protein